MGKPISEKAAPTPQLSSLRATARLDNRGEAKNRTPAIGIDMGGTKTEAIVLSAAGEALDRWRVPSAVGDYDGTVRLLCGMVERAEAAFGPAGSVGIGIPGTISPASGLVKNANSTWLIGRPFQTDVEAALGRAVAVANDADCFALSEATDGAGAGGASVWGVILGTGVGGGIVVEGRLLAGPNAIAGEWGHCPLPWPADDERPGPACYCGHAGCIETFLSGPGFARDFRAHGGPDLSPAEIAARATAGDARAAAAVDRYVDRLARASAMVIDILDPAVIVLGGGMSNLAAIYERVPALWPRYVFSDRVDTRLVPPRFGDSSGVRGAAWLGRMRRKYPEQSAR
jgi:fructokinase